MATAGEKAATALKLQGNKAFASHDWIQALDLYSKAIEEYDQDPSFFCNRAQVCFSFPISASLSCLFVPLSCPVRLSREEVGEHSASRKCYG